MQFIDFSKVKQDSSWNHQHFGGFSVWNIFWNQPDRAMTFQTKQLFLLFVWSQICLTDFQTSQSEAILVSHCTTDWPYFEHWWIWYELYLLGSVFRFNRLLFSRQGIFVFTSPGNTKTDHYWHFSFSNPCTIRAQIATIRICFSFVSDSESQPIMSDQHFQICSFLFTQQFLDLFYNSINWPTVFQETIPLKHANRKSRLNKNFHNKK